MLMKNDTGHRQQIPGLKVDLAAGECCEIPDGYCLPRRSAGGARIPSVVESLAPGMRPADPAAWAEWLKSPPEEGNLVGNVVPAKPKSAFMGEGLPEGLAEIAAAKDKLRAEKAKATAQKAGLGTEAPVDPMPPPAPEPPLAPAHTSETTSETPVSKTPRKGKNKEQ